MVSRLAGRRLPAILWRGGRGAPAEGGGGGCRGRPAAAVTPAALTAGGGGVGGGAGGGWSRGAAKGRGPAAAVSPPLPADGGRRAATSTAAATPSPAPVHPASNIPPSIWALTHRRLYTSPPHPLATLATRLAAHLATAPHMTPPEAEPAVLHTALDPVVSVDTCFDALGVPPSHPSRAASDTYYVSPDRVLRPHMTAHTVPLLAAGGSPAFLTVGDVYRRDTIDATHYPAFHQMDGVRLLPGRTVTPAAALAHLRLVLLSTARALFGPTARLRWVAADFPFTYPSVELEVWWGGEWLELLGAGLLTPQVLAAAGWEPAADGTGLEDIVAAAATGEVPPPGEGVSPADAAVAAAVGGAIVRGEPVVGWAFGLGLDRLAMVLHGIPDIRLLWSRDERFLSQFRHEQARDAASANPADVTQFVPYSKYPPVAKDLSFWLPPAGIAPTTTADSAVVSAGEEGEATATLAAKGGGNATASAVAAAAAAAAPPPGGAATTFAADDADDPWRGVENSVCEVVRATAGDVVEAVTRVGEPYTRDGAVSLCFRVTYRSMDRSLTHAEVDALQARVREGVVAAMGVRLR